MRTLGCLCFYEEHDFRIKITRKRSLCDYCSEKDDTSSVRLCKDMYAI